MEASGETPTAPQVATGGSPRSSQTGSSALAPTSASLLGTSLEGGQVPEHEFLQCQSITPDKVGNTPTATTTFSGGCNFRCPLYINDYGSTDEAQRYKDWASPEEVLQLQALCTDLSNKHKSDMTVLQRELEEARKNCDVLRAEVAEARKLRELYTKAQDLHEKARLEGARWEGERELFRVQLQRAALENQRLVREQQALQRSHGRRSHQFPPRQGNWLQSERGSGEGPPPSPVLVTGSSSLPTPSVTTSSGAYQNIEQRRSQDQRRRHILDGESVGGFGSDFVSEDLGGYYSHYRCPSGGSTVSRENEFSLREQLRLLEELHRSSMSCAELEARLNFTLTLWDLSAARDAQHALMLRAECEKLKTQLNHWRDVAEDVTGRLDATSAQLRDCQGDLDNTRREVQSANAATSIVLAAERQKAEDAVELLKRLHTEELARVKQQLQQALDDSANSRIAMQQALDSANKRAEAQCADLLSCVTGTEHRLSEAVREKNMSELALSEAKASHEQQISRLNRELTVLQSVNRQCVQEKAQQVEELRLLREANAQLEIHLREKEAELQQVRGSLNDATNRLLLAAEQEEELASTRLQLQAGAREAEEQKSYYEEQVRLHQAAFARLQRQHEEEVQRLKRDLCRLKQRSEARKIKLLASLKGFGQVKADALPCDHVADEAVDGSGATERCSETDVLLLLRQSAASASTLARTIHRGSCGT
ncbi:hypothetical protein TRVL_04346 [Trypanosoma vivax]|nr:hypothetical protein TRVL_04346 [Trypanosoma vivax]